jgi:hypothetical protein
MIKLNFTTMINPSKIVLDKTEVARRQLGAAIDLWFADGEPVAIHTLACAAHEVLASLLKKQGKSTLMFDPAHYQPGCAGEARKMLHKHYNFFKHADHNEATIEFPVGVTEIYLLMAAEGWRELVGSRQPVHFAFWAWCYMHHPEIMKLRDNQTGAPMDPLPTEMVQEFITLPKEQFRMLTIMAFNRDASHGVVAKLGKY